MVQIQDVTPVDDDAARSGERLRLAGNAAYNSGDFEAAARSYRDSLEAAPLPSPSAPKALGNLAKALLMLGHPGEALANAERYVQACPPGTPDAAKARFRKGEALEATGDLRLAREAYRDAAKDAPGDEKVRGALARVSETIERRRRESAEPGVSAKAETRFETAERETSRARAPPRATKTLTLDDEKKNQAAYSRAKRAIREARYEEAVEAFACYTLPPSRPDRALSLFLNRARALTELGRHEEALRDARAAVSADQESPRARYRLGVTALAAAEAAAEQARKMVSVLSHDENDKTKTKTFDLRSRAEALAREARDEGFGYGARLEDVFEKYDDASAFAKGREACETFLRCRDFSLPLSDKATDKGDPVIVDPERRPTKSTPEKEKPEGVSVRDPPAEEKEKRKTGAATVSVTSLAAYARRETARRERLGSEGKKDPFFPDSRTFEHEGEDDVFAFRESVRVFGCAVVRLPASLNDDDDKKKKKNAGASRLPKDVFEDAVAAASAFFATRPEEKKRSLPNTRAAPHGYLRPLEETRVDSFLSNGSNARRDETVLERFSACAAFDAAYVWPSAKFKARVDAVSSVLEETAKAAGDAFLIDHFATIESLTEEKRKREKLEAYEAKLDAMMFAPENQRTTLAKHPDAPPGKRGGEILDEILDEDATTAKLRAALDPIVRESEAEPERNFLSFFPRVCVAKTTSSEADEKKKKKKKTRTPAVRVRRGDLETTFSAAPTATGGDLDVLVVAGERFRDIMGEAWPLPTVSFDGEEREGPCVRLVYRV